MSETSGQIPNIAETHCVPWLGEVEDLARIGYSLAVLLVGSEDRLSPEVTEAAPTTKPLLLVRLIAHECGEHLYPGIVLVPVEEIDALLESLL